MIKTTLNNISTDKKVVDITKEKNKNIVNILKGTVISILLSLILLTIYSALLSFTNISESTMTTVVLVITGISILLGSSMSSINIKKQGMLNGGLVGLIYVLLIYLLSSIFLVGFQFNLNSIIMIAVGILTGMIAGIIGVNLGK